MSRFIRLVASSAAFFGQSQALAQNVTISTNDIVVLGQPLPLPPGTPAYGSVELNRERLSQAASGRVENALADVAGFQQFRRSDSRSANPSAQGATLRALGGNASSRTLVLLDGVPMSDPFFGYIPFTAITPDQLGGVRVTRGGGSGPFGAGAVAGTIELVGATRPQLPFYSASAFYGSRDSQELSASFSPDLGAGFVTLSGRFERGDGFQTTPASQRVAATVPARYRDWSLGLRAVVPIGHDSEVQARALVFRDDRTLRFAGAGSSSEGEDASIRLIHRGPWQVDALAYLQRRNFTNIVISATSFRRTLDQRDTPSTGLGGKLEIRPPLSTNHVMRLGADVRRAIGDMYEDAYNANLAANPLTALRHAGGNQTSIGMFVEDDWTLGRLVLTGGARIDRWMIRGGFFQQRTPAGALVSNNRFTDRAGWRASFRAGALFNVTDALAFRAAGYSGFRLPTLNELYRPFTVFPITTLANAGLNPEKLKGVEGGVDLRPIAGVKLSGTLFYNRLDGAIANVTTGAVTRERQNVDAVIAKGVELTAEARFGDFDLSASYAFSDSKVRATGASTPLDGKVPAQSPRHAASASFAWTPKSGAIASVTVRHVGLQYEDDLQTDRLPPATTVDAYLAIPLRDRISLVGRAENLFDKAVVTRNAQGSIDLGTPRTLWLGVRIEG